MHLETRRKFLVHGLTGIGFSLMIYLLPLDLSLAIFVVLLGITIYLARRIGKGKRYPVISWVVEKTERPGKPIAKGVIWYFYGVIFILVIFGLIGVPRIVLASSLLVVALGDSVSTGLGRILGKRRLPRTKTKTYEGTGLGFLAAFVGIFVFLLLEFDIGSAFWISFSGSFVGMLTEAYLRGPDDNFTIPAMACSAMVITLALIKLIGMHVLF